MVLEVAPSSETPDFGRIVAALSDADCREIIAILDEPKTVAEIAADIELPLSTAYRKLDRLTEADLASEADGVWQDGHYQSRYVIAFDRIEIGFDDERAFRVDVDRSNEQSLGLWSSGNREV